MTSPVTCDLVIAATFLSGILAGATFDRMIVQMPAWRCVGMRAWAEYSRKADLGNGLIFYPLVAISGAVFTIAATVSLHRSNSPTFGICTDLWGGSLGDCRVACYYQGHS